MAQRYIYLSDELNAKLKREENASALICRLLNDYYGKEIISDLPIEDLKKKLEIAKVELEAEKAKEIILNG